MKVPLYEGHVALTAETPGGMGPMAPQAPQGSLEQAGLPYQKLQEVGGALTQIGAEVKRHMDRGRQLKDLNDANFAAEDQNIDLQRIVKENPDPHTWVDLYKQGMLDYKENSLSNLSNSEVKAVHTKHVDRLFFSGLKSVQAAADQQNASIYLADVEPNLKKDAELYVQASGDDFEQIRIKGQAFGRLDAGVAARVIYPAKAQQLKQNWESYVTQAQGNQDVLQDPMGAFERLGDPAKNYPGMDAQSALALRGRAQTEVHRVQSDNYSRYMQKILGVTADNPVQGAVMPTEEEILPQIGKTLSVPGAQNILAYIRGQKTSAGTGQENKTDPQSYKEAATRLTDPDNPLTREEFLKNVESGEWKFDAKTYGGFLSNINAGGGKLDRVADSAIRSRIGFWKTQFGMDPKGDQIMTALGQLQAAKDAGELGKTPEEVNKAVDSIFKPQHDIYMQEWSMGTKKPAQTKPGIISRFGGYFGGQGGPAPAGTAVLPGGPGSIRNDKRWMSNDVQGSK